MLLFTTDQVEQYSTYPKFALQMTVDDFTRLGIALSKAQTIEFVIYGLLTHLKKTPEIVPDKRLRNLTPRQFLSSDPADKVLRKMTLGQLNAALPEGFGLSPEFLQDYVERRNIVVHEFMREINPRYATKDVLNPTMFLNQFIADSQELELVLEGLFYVIMDQIAQKNGIPERKPSGENVTRAKSAFFSHVQKRLSEQGVAPQSATRSESDSEGGDNAHIESEARSR